MSSGATNAVALVGLGNIGSHLVPHLARTPGITRVLLVDRDRYSPGNRAGQDIEPEAVGRPKAEFQAERLLRINSSLDVVPICEDLESLPRAALQCRVLLGCVDSKRARQHLNEVALHLGLPWVDAGVGVLDTGDLLARVTVLEPGPSEACLECSWAESDYAAVEQTYPCAAAEKVPATNAPSALGALAASLQAIEFGKILSGEKQGVGRQVMIDATHHSQIVTRFFRNLSCRLNEHGPWSLKRLLLLPLLSMTVGQLLERLTGLCQEPAQLSVEGFLFARRRACLFCRTSQDALGLKRSARPDMGRCLKCHGQLVASAFDLDEQISISALGSRDLDSSLQAVGFMAGDILRVDRGDRTERFVIVDDSR
jgi:molybdopterin/thiamine biosynthesis adenylyltransferase